jgi:glutamine amidotransferase
MEVTHMRAIIDTGLTELHQIQNAFAECNQETIITADKETLSGADQLILYSTSSFGTTMYRLQERELVTLIKQFVIQGKPLYGIGVGMQLLFTGSDEEGFHQGLNLLPGRVVPIHEPSSFQGFSWVSFKYPHPLLRDIEEGEGYFTQAFYVKATNADDVIALNEQHVPAIVGRGNIFGVQFYPERSGGWGTQFLKSREICKNR